jgi:peptidyl-prolyl cis-trans isomerase B (cyclophilin B)
MLNASKGSALILFLSCLLIGLVSCSEKPAASESKDSTQGKPSKEAPAKKKQDTVLTVTTPEYPKLTNENIEAFLLQYFEDNPEREVIVSTRLGEVKVRLYDETPLHTANFLMMTKRDYFNGTEFIRVVPKFVVQGGNNESEIEEVKRLLIGAYTIPPEFDEKLYHKKGALSAARSYEGNPDKRSSPYDFFFVHGQTFNEPQLMAMERDNSFTIPDWKREIYQTVGGAPHLDHQHTVFGEIVEGFDVLDKMASVETDGSDWPVKPLVMEVKVSDE